MNSKVIEDTNFNYIIKKIQSIFDTEITPITVKLMMFFYLSIYSKIVYRIEGYYVWDYKKWAT